ncbi:unnamed protein product, partial [Urochloa humidicola]
VGAGRGTAARGGSGERHGGGLSSARRCRSGELRGGWSGERRPEHGVACDGRRPDTGHTPSRSGGAARDRSAGRGGRSRELPAAMPTAGSALGAPVTPFVGSRFFFFVF